jgi:plasmid segregation protein ParM
LSSLWKRKGEKIQMSRIWKQILRKGRRDRNMNNKLEVIGIDHGWSMMKTISQVFVTGVKEITTTPALFGDVLEYEGKFYKILANNIFLKTNFLH